MPSKYRKKPVVIEAIQFDGKNWNAIKSFCADSAVSRHGDEIDIHTLEGTMTANVGDWIIKGVNGEFYPCKPDIFAATYEEVEPEPRAVEEESNGI